MSANPAVILHTDAPGRAPAARAGISAHETINAPVRAPTSRLDNGSRMDIPGRAWSYITLGYGNGEGWLSIEHEDVMLSREAGVCKLVDFVKNVTPSESRDFKPREI